MGILIFSHEAGCNAAKFLKRHWFLLLLLLICVSVSAKAAAQSGVADTQWGKIAFQADPTLPRGPDSAVNPEPAGNDGSASRLNRTTGLMGLLIRTYTTDPLMRPVSTTKKLVSLLTDTFTDVVQRGSINAILMPALEDTPVPSLSNEPGMDLQRWEHELDQITGSKASTGTLEFLIDGEEFFSNLIKGITGARESIQLRTYIFDNDDYAIKIADLLRQRSHDVHVEVLIDGLGTLFATHTDSPTMPESFSPPASITRYLEDGSRVSARIMTNPWFTGDHSKVTIIDRKEAFLGGMNIGREYRYDWHDLMVKVTGPVVEQLARDADAAWARSGMLGDLALLAKITKPSNASVSDDGYPLRILYTRAESSQIYQAQLAAIRRAQKYIYIENTYFTDDVILYELIRARRRGVDVRFVIAERTDNELMDKNNIQTINKMLSNGIRVYMYPRMTHVKAALYDDWLIVGSANLDKMSMRVNHEVNIATSYPAAVKDLKERLFNRDFDMSVELTELLPSNWTHYFAELVGDVLL